MRGSKWVWLHNSSTTNCVTAPEANWEGTIWAKVVLCADPSQVGEIYRWTQRE